ncbi:ATP-dependent nuclease [Bradyrhizobium canariense]|uniref:ATP-dependent nuclease n=1 Tax=Bradyrhizobium canariense TaxID=255045 RepID=UPI0013747AC2|nr:AAA family ATPase [Bradyrhizobium canariense]
MLEAIALLFSAAPNFALSEFDYHNRDVAVGFSIEAVLSVGDGAFLREEGFPAPPLQGWLDGKLTELPDEDGAEAVLVCRLTGTPDQETQYEIIGAGGEIRLPFSRAMRRRIGLVRLGVADRGDRDIRLVQGGALDRYLQGQDVRQTVLQAVMKTPLHDQLNDGPKSALTAISDGFKKRNLPHPVRLGLVGTPGVSLAASVGLTVGATDNDALPLATWGTGTRRLAALEISTLGVRADAIAVIDEPETGLEPYRQRVFIRDLASTPRQAFVTTHAPAVLSQALNETSQTWRIGDVVQGTETKPPKEGDPRPGPDSHALVAVRGAEITAIASTQSEALFAKLPVVCEGVTEKGFATRLFEHRFGSGYSCRGLFCLDAGGHYRALPICKELIDAGFPLAAVVDDEGKKSGGWSDVGSAAILLRWKGGECLEKVVLSALSDTMLQEVHEWADQAIQRNAVHQLGELRIELGFEKGFTAAQMFAKAGRDRFLEALVARACPKPEGNRKPRGWFKSFEGGYLLADKLLSVAPPPALMAEIDAFLVAVEAATAP